MYTEAFSTDTVSTVMCSTDTVRPAIALLLSVSHFLNNPSKAHTLAQFTSQNVILMLVICNIRLHNSSKLFKYTYIPRYDELVRPPE